MSSDIVLWRRVILDQVASLADAAGQRVAWLERGPWNAGPQDEIDLFFRYADVTAFLARTDHGLSQRQATALARLAGMLGRLRDNRTVPRDAETMITDRRWQAIRRQARAVLGAMSDAA